MSWKCAKGHNNMEDENGCQQCSTPSMSKPSEKAMQFNAKTVERFWSRVSVRADNDCWPFQGAINKGYGRVSLEGKTYSAHRVALAIYGGNERTDLFAIHSCDNKTCCNPHHLRWGTHLENMADRNERNTEWRAKSSKRMAQFGLINAARMRHLLPSQLDYAMMLVEAGYTAVQVAKWYQVSKHVIYKSRERYLKQQKAA